MRRSPEKAKIQTDLAFYNEMTYISREFLDDYPDQPQLQPYFDAFNNALQNFREMIDKNDKLITKITDLNQTILNNAENVRQIISQVEYDKQEVKELSLEYENATKKLEVHQRKEKENINTVNGLQFDFDSYNTIAQEYFAKEKEKEDIQNKNDEIRHEIEENKKKIDELTQELNEARDTMNNSQNELNEITESNNNLTKEKKETKELFQTLRQNNNDCIEEMHQITVKIDEMQKETESLNEILKTAKVDPNLKKNISELKAEMKKQKSKKEKRTHVIEYKQKTLNAMLKEDDGLVSYQNKIKAKIQANDEKLVELRADLEEQEVIYAEVKPKADEIMEKDKKLREEKQAIRNKTREMTKQVINLEFENVTMKNQSNMIERHVFSEQYSLKNIENDIKKENNHQIEVKNQQSILSVETMNSRKTKQKMMENATKILDEIEAKEVETSHIKTNIMAANSEVEKLKIHNEQLLTHLQEIKDKTDKQSILVEKLRTERNMYKKMSEKAEAETGILQQQYDDLITKISEMTDKIDYLIETTQVDHDAAKVVKEASEFIERMRDQTKIGVKASEKVNAKLIQEAVNLQSLLHKSQWDFRQQKKEYAMLVNTFHIVANQLLHKEKKIENMRSEIESTEAVLSKSRKQYSDKIHFMLKLQKDYEYYMNVNQRLEKLWQKTERLQGKELELSEALAVAQLKRGKLVQEMTVPRNVHRYTLLEVQNPELAKQYKYVHYVHFRLQEVDNQLNKLKEEKQKLLQEIDKRNELETRITQGMTAEECMNRIAIYQEDLKQKEQQLKDMEDMINNTRIDIADEIWQVSTTRSSVTQRRASTARIKKRRTFIRQKPDSEVFYLTSAVSDVPEELTDAQQGRIAGTSFLPRAPQSARGSRRFRSKKHTEIHEPDEPPTKPLQENNDFNAVQNKTPHVIPKITKIKKKRLLRQPQSARIIRQSNIV